jgi:hypothetical protein
VSGNAAVKPNSAAGRQARADAAVERDLRRRRARVASERDRLVAELGAGQLPAHRHVLDHLAALGRELQRIDAQLGGRPGGLPARVPEGT